MSQNLSTPTTGTQAAPVAQKERITILDSLRGFAILGILLMNIPSFGGASHDPTILNETGANYRTWFLISWIFDGTQRALFSMLFGAGIILFVRSAEKKVDGLQPADYFFRRQLWLLVFSLFDVFILLWSGDILLDYALFGMMLFTFRKLPAKNLLIAAGVCLLFMLARENRDFYKSKKVITRGEAAEAIDTSTIKLTSSQKGQLSALNDFRERSTLEKRKKNLQDRIQKVGRSNYEDLYESRTNGYVDDLVEYIFFGLWDVLLFMFIGMAFFKLGILTGEVPAKVYWWMLGIGLSVGLFLSYSYLQPYIRYRFNRFEYVKNVQVEYYQLARLFRSLGLFAGLMLLYKSGVFKWLFALLQPVGQMAFTNYLLQSFICGTYFYSAGFAMYGKLQRYELYFVVAAVWVFQVIFSHVWLRYFRFGPFEWAWRSLTYWRKQPFRRM